MTLAAPASTERWPLGQSLGQSLGQWGSRAFEAVRAAALPAVVMAMVTLGIGPWLGEAASLHGATVFTSQPHAQAWMLIGGPVLVLLRAQFLPPAIRREFVVSRRLVTASLALGLTAGVATALIAMGVHAASLGTVPGPVAGLIAALPVAATLTYAPTWLVVNPRIGGAASARFSFWTIRRLGRRALPAVGLSTAVVLADWLTWVAPASLDRAALVGRVAVGVGVVASARLSTRSMTEAIDVSRFPTPGGYRIFAVLATAIVLLATLASAGVLRPSVGADHSGATSVYARHLSGIRWTLRSYDALPTTVTIISVNAPPRAVATTVALTHAVANGDAPPHPVSGTSSLRVGPYNAFGLQLTWHGAECSIGDVPVALRLDTLGHSRVEHLVMPVTRYC